MSVKDRKQQRQTLSSYQNRLISKSAVYRIQTVKSDKNKFQQQLSEYKEKAHKSFLQVMQMEHLHQEQIEQLKAEFEEQQLKSQKTVQQLKQKLLTVENQLKISNKHIMDLSNSFIIENIDQIHCKQQDNDSMINQSSILQIKEILTLKDNKSEKSLQQFKKQVYQQLKLSYLKNSQYQKNITKTIQKIFTFIASLTSQNVKLRIKIQEANNCFYSLQAQFKNLKIQYESSQKQGKFLSDHIKRILSDKSALEKKVNQLQKNKKMLEENIKILKKNVSQNLSNDVITKKSLSKYQNDHSQTKLINSSTTTTTKIEDLNVSKDIKLLLTTQNVGNIIYQNLKLKGSIDLQSNKPIQKGFRKLKGTLQKIQNNN